MKINMKILRLGADSIEKLVKIVDCRLKWFFVHGTFTDNPPLIDFLPLVSIKIITINRELIVMDGWIVSGGVALLHAGHKTGLMCTTVFYL
jgi:hypothetical protein